MVRCAQSSFAPAVLLLSSWKRKRHSERVLHDSSLWNAKPWCARTFGGTGQDESLLEICSGAQSHSDICSSSTQVSRKRLRHNIKESCSSVKPSPQHSHQKCCWQNRHSMNTHLAHENKPRPGRTPAPMVIFFSF